MHHRGLAGIGSAPVAESKPTSNALSKRHNVEVLIATRTPETSSQLRQALKSLGFGNIVSVAQHSQALTQIKSRRFQLAIFDAVSKDMSAVEFVEEARASHQDVILTALTNQPQIDDVFSLIQAGANWFVINPFTIDSLEYALGKAARGVKLNRILLNCTDRNAALSLIIMNNLYRLTMIMNYAKNRNLDHELHAHYANFVESSEMARYFCEGTLEDMRERIMEECVARAEVARTRLGQTRRKLQQQRKKEKGELPQKGRSGPS